jgi:DNA polymerase II large subunit
MDVLLNFNPSFIPERRGSKMDAPFVITPLLEPKEVDDMVFNLDIVKTYPLSLYEGAQQMKHPWDVSIKTIRNVLDTEEQYDKMLCTNETAHLGDAVVVSTYKKLENMRQLVHAQLALAEKISSADADKVASLVVRRHILQDITKNLDRYFVQEFRCPSCKLRLRRPTMNGQCPKCKGNIVPTVHIASVVKYKDILMEIKERYNLEEDVASQTEELLLRLTSLGL